MLESDANYTICKDRRNAWLGLAADDGAKSGNVVEWRLETRVEVQLAAASPSPS